MSKPTAVIAMEGVLRSPVGGAPLPQGMSLLGALNTNHVIALISDESSTEKVEHWLKVHGVNQHSYLLVADKFDPEDVGERRVRHIKRLRANGVTGSIVLVEADPRAAQACFEVGVPCLLFAYPQYLEPKHRPDHVDAIRPWADLVEEVERQNSLRTADQRLNTEPL